MYARHKRPRGESHQKALDCRNYCWWNWFGTVSISMRRVTWPCARERKATQRNRELLIPFHWLCTQGFWSGSSICSNVRVRCDRSFKLDRLCRDVGCFFSFGVSSSSCCRGPSSWCKPSGRSAGNWTCQLASRRKFPGGANCFGIPSDGVRASVAMGETARHNSWCLLGLRLSWRLRRCQQNWQWAGACWRRCWCPHHQRQQRNAKDIQRFCWGGEGHPSSSFWRRWMPTGRWGRSDYRRRLIFRTGGEPRQPNVVFAIVLRRASSDQGLHHRADPLGIPRIEVGKGLSAINHQVWELIDKVERENRLQSRPTLPILVVIGWAGNDVHGDFGYQGCTWIHQTNLTKSEADRKVAAEYVDK